MCQPIEVEQAKHRLERYLYEVGALFLFAKTVDDRDWAWSGNERDGLTVPEPEELGPLRDEIEVDGVVYTDIRRLFVRGELPFPKLLNLLKQMDGSGAVMYSPTDDMPGPDGRQSYTLHLILRNIYSSEEKEV
jgi:hypothetical protein